MARSGWRVCSTPGCPEMVEGGTRCPACVAAAEQRRGTSSQRSYDYKHQMAREALLRRLRRAEAAGRPAPKCPRCGQPMTSDQDLQFGHSTDQALSPGARADRLEHGRCNNSAGGALGAAITNSR